MHRDGAGSRNPVKCAGRAPGWTLSAPGGCRSNRPRENAPGGAEADPECTGKVPGGSDAAKSSDRCDDDETTTTTTTTRLVFLRGRGLIDMS